MYKNKMPKSKNKIKHIKRRKKTSGSDCGWLSFLSSGSKCWNFAPARAEEDGEDGEEEALKDEEEEALKLAARARICLLLAWQSGM